MRWLRRQFCLYTSFGGGGNVTFDRVEGRLVHTVALFMVLKRGRETADECITPKCG